MSDNNSNFAQGLFVKKPHTKAPDFIKAELSFKVEEFIEWAKENANDAGYVNVTVKESKNGTFYGQINDWQPSKQEPTTETLGGQASEPTDDLPF